MSSARLEQYDTFVICKFRPDQGAPEVELRRGGVVQLVISWLIMIKNDHAGEHTILKMPF